MSLRLGLLFRAIVVAAIAIQPFARASVALADPAPDEPASSAERDSSNKTAQPNKIELDENGTGDLDPTAQDGPATGDPAAIAAIDSVGGEISMKRHYGLCADLSLRAITDQDILLLAPFPAVKRLDLRYSKVTDAGLANLAKLQEIRNLNLSFTGIDGSGLAHLKDLKSLVGLDLAYTKIDDDALKRVAMFENLRRLNLGHTKVTGVGIEQLKWLKKLQFIIVPQAVYSAELSERLKKEIPKLTVYDDAPEPLTGGVPMMPGEPSWAITTARRSLRSSEDLQAPFDVMQTAYFMDGGSVGVVLWDAKDKELAICVSHMLRGSERYPKGRVFLGGIHPTTAGTRVVPLEGPERQRLIAALENAIIESAPRLEEKNPRKVKLRIAYDILHQLKDNRDAAPQPDDE